MLGIEQTLKSVAKAILPKRFHRNTELFYSVALRWTRRILSRQVPLDKLLLGDEYGISAYRYAQITGDLKRPSTPLRQIPHVNLLVQYESIGDAVFDPTIFSETDYYKNALQAIELLGHYFEARSKEEIGNQARKFVDMYRSYDEGNKIPAFNKQADHSYAGSPIILRKIKYSDGSYQIVDGHHRAAILMCKGKTFCSAYVLKEPAVLTPLQHIVLDGLWTRGEKVLYQPIDMPEFGEMWQRPRKCKDRFEKMISWLNNHSFESRGKSYIDLGSSYGWFVSKMLELGYDAFGVERDRLAIKTGEIAYGIDRERIYAKEIGNFLEDTEKKFNVVSCFSVLHHFVLGKSSRTAEEILRMIDTITQDVLFFDTGQSHEQWFRHELKEWTDDYIVEWIKSHSSFTRVEKLGCDEDRSPSYEDNYGRMLFAFTR